jgi:hypothetical protein
VHRGLLRLPLAARSCRSGLMRNFLVESSLPPPGSSTRAEGGYGVIGAATNSFPATFGLGAWREVRPGLGEQISSPRISGRPTGARIRSVDSVQPIREYGIPSSTSPMDRW